MRCIECNKPFKPTRANVKLCGDKCRLARHRRLRLHTPDREMRREVEAKRLVAEYAVLRPGMQPHGITATRLREIRSVIAASARL